MSTISAWIPLRHGSAVLGRRALVGAVALALIGCGTDTVAPPDQQNDDETQPVVATVELDPDSDTLTYLGATLTLEPTAAEADGTVVTDRSYDWSSSDPEVATVDPDGMVTAASEGSTEITASVDGVEGQATIVVAQAPTQLGFAQPPTHSLAGSAVASGVEVEVLDAGDNPVGSWSEVVSLELVDPPAGVVLSGETTGVPADGVVRFEVIVEQPAEGLVLRASSGALDAVESEPFHVWDEPVHVDSLVMRGDTLAIGGAGVGYTVWLTNIGPTVETAWVQGYVEQSGVLNAGGGRVAACDGAPLGELPPGSCDFSFSLGARDDGGLVPGPATAIFEIRGEGSTSFRHEVTRPITLVEFVPPVPPDVYFGTVTFDDTVLTLGGASVVYEAVIENDEVETVPNVIVQGTVEQGATVRAAGGARVFCTPQSGDVPPGGCVHSFTAAADNGFGGTGTLVPGDAIVRLLLYTYIDGVQVDLDDVTVDVTLVN